MGSLSQKVCISPKGLPIGAWNQKGSSNEVFAYWLATTVAGEPK